MERKGKEINPETTFRYHLFVCSLIYHFSDKEKKQRKQTTSKTKETKRK